MLTEHAHATAVLESLGIDPNTVLAHGADETGYLVLGRHQDGTILTTVDGPEMSRVPWTSRDAWLRFQEADRLDAGAARPRRVQLSRAKGWRKPDNTVVVARPTRYGNPFRYRDETHGLVRYRREEPETIDYEGRISHDGNMHPWYGPDGTVVPFYVRYATRAELVWLFRRTLLNPTPSMVLAYPSREGGFAKVTVDEIRAELAGKNLACWCPLDQPCHADVLLEIANGAAS